MVALVFDVKARAATTYLDLVPTSLPAKRLSEDSEALLIKSKVQEHRVGFVLAGVQTEREDPSATVLPELSDEPAPAEQAAYVREIQCVTWPGQVLKSRVCIIARFRAFTTQEERQRERLIHKTIQGTLIVRKTREFEPLDYEADHGTLSIPQVGEFHGFDAILS
ncbi:hypothetical protein BDR22DRAFT_395613 [Usnea florida]